MQTTLLSNQTRKQLTTPTKTSQKHHHTKSSSETQTNLKHLLKPQHNIKIQQNIKN